MKKGFFYGDGFIACGDAPTAADLAEIADLPVAEALDAAESRGLVPPGWASDESRAWHCWPCDGTGVLGPPSRAIRLACGSCAVQVKSGSLILTRGGDGTRPAPATTADLGAVLSLDWRRAEVLAREVVRELRKYGHPGGDVRVVWRVVLPSERRPLTVWRAGDVCMTPEGCVGHKGEPITPASQLDAARELATMGLRLGAVTDDAVTLVCLRG